MNLLTLVSSTLALILVSPARVGPVASQPHAGDALAAGAAQAKATPPAYLDLESLDPARRLDFLEGDWLTSSPGVAGSAGSSSTWVTHVERSLMGQVLTMESTGALTHFVHLARQGAWKAVFISPLGDFDTLEGGLLDGKIVLVQSMVRGRPDAIARTTFYDVHEGGFRSDFESSTDGGATWTVDFAMLYQRTGESPNDLLRLRGARSLDAPEEVGKLSYLLGRWALEYKLMLPDGSTTRGRGVSFVRFDATGEALVEESEVLFDSWTSTRTRVVRTWDAAAGAWLVDRSSDRSPQPLRLTARRTPDGLIEERLDSEGKVLERMSLTLIAGNKLITRSERVAADGTSEPDGALERIATRLE